MGYHLEKPIVLVGPMGSGKSTVARFISARLDIISLDTDVKVEEIAGKKIPDIFREDGEEAFRHLETQALKYCLDTVQLIATGGGVVGEECNYEILRRGFVAYLYAPVGVQYQRTLALNNRPMIDVEDRRKRLKELFEERHPRYKQVADYTVDTSAHPVKECADMIINELLEKHILREIADGTD